MANKVQIPEPFETLGNVARDAIKETLQEPGKVLETAGSQTGIKADPGTEKMAGQGQGQLPTFVQAQQKAQKQNLNKKKLTWLEDELKGLQDKRKQESSSAPSASLRASEDKEQVKQLEMQEQKKVELIPIPVKNAKNKGGTREIPKKIGG